MSADPSIVALREGLDAADAGLRAAALRGFLDVFTPDRTAELPADVVARIDRACADEDATVRGYAAWARALLGPLGDLSGLASSLRHGDGQVRYAAVVKLACYHDRTRRRRPPAAVLAGLSALLEDHRGSARLWAARAIAVLGRPAQQLAPALVRAIPRREREPELAREIAAALGCLGDRTPATLAALLALLDHRDESVRLAAVTALGFLRAPEAIEPLHALLVVDPPSRCHGLAALARIAPARALALALDELPPVIASEPQPSPFGRTNKSLAALHDVFVRELALRVPGGAADERVARVRERAAAAAGDADRQPYERLCGEQALWRIARSERIARLRAEVDALTSDDLAARARVAARSLALAAHLGFAPARAALRLPAATFHDLPTWYAAIGDFGREAVVRGHLALGHLVLPVWNMQYGDDASPGELLRASERWVRAPSRERQVNVEEQMCGPNQWCTWTTRAAVTTIATIGRWIVRHGATDGRSTQAAFRSARDVAPRQLVASATRALTNLEPRRLIVAGRPERAVLPVDDENIYLCPFDEVSALIREAVAAELLPWALGVGDPLATLAEA